MDDVRTKKLGQIQKLLNQASDAGTTEAEAQAFRQHADTLMLAYQITEFEVRQTQSEAEREHPEDRWIKLCGINDPIKKSLVDLFNAVSVHCRCKSVFSGLRDSKSASSAHIVGFPTDIDFAEMLYTSLRVQMARGLEPQVDPMLSEVENLVVLKEAGMKWARIHQLLHPEDPEPVKKAQGVRYTKLYTEYCTMHDRPRQYTDPATYQRNYSMGYAEEVSSRLWEIRTHRDDNLRTHSGMEIAVRDEVNAKANEVFGRVKSILGPRTKLDVNARSNGAQAGSQADLGPKVGSVGRGAPKELT